MRRMDIERVFMSCYKIEEQPDDIFNLIELALRVGAFKYQPQFEKRKARIIKFLMNPSITSTDDYDEEEEVIEDNVGDQDDVTSVEEPEKKEVDGLGTQQITAESNKPLVTKIRIVIRKSVQVAAAEKQNNCNAITESSTELKKTDLVQQLDKQGTPQSHNSTTMPSRKRMNESTKRVQVAAPRVRLLSDLSFEKHPMQEKRVHHWFNKEHAAAVDEDECTSFSSSSSKTKQLQFKYKTNAENITKLCSCKTNAKRNTK